MCLRSVEDELSGLSPADLRIYIFDNNSDTETKNVLLDFHRKFQPFIERLIFNPRNIGKAKGLNTFLPDIQDEDLLISLDSDLQIVSPKQQFFQTMQELYVGLPSCAVLVPEQLGNSQHILDGYTWEDVQVNGRTISVIESTYGFHIAGGCLAIRGALFKNIKGYRENRGLFGGDDGFLFLDAADSSEDRILLTKALQVFHPEGTDAGYIAWKRKALSQQDSAGRCLLYKGFYDEKRVDTQSPTQINCGP